MSIKRMMTMMVAPLTLASNLAFSDEFFTEQSFYLGAQYTQTSLKASAFGVSVEWEPSNIILQGGTKLNEYISLEGRYGFKAGSDEINGVSLELESLTGFYGKFGTKGRVSVYGIVGLSSLEFSSNNASGTDSESGLSFGVGLDYNITEKAALNLEYMNYFSDEVEQSLDLDVTALALGARYHF